MAKIDDALDHYLTSLPTSVGKRWHDVYRHQIATGAPAADAKVVAWTELGVGSVPAPGGGSIYVEQLLNEDHVRQDEYNESEERDAGGKWTGGGSGSAGVTKAARKFLTAALVAPQPWSKTAGDLLREGLGDTVWIAGKSHLALNTAGKALASTLNTMGGGSSKPLASMTSERDIARAATKAAGGTRVLPFSPTASIPAARNLPDVSEPERIAASLAAGLASADDKSVGESVNKYTSFRYQDINASLRSGEPDGQDAVNIRTFIRNAPKLKKDAVMYRAVRGGSLNDLKPGDVATDLGFVSASTSRVSAKGFLLNGPGALFEIEVDKGAPMAAISQSDYEREVVFPPRTSFQVISVTDVTTPRALMKYTDAPIVHVVRAKMILADNWETAGSKRVDAAWRQDEAETESSFEDRILWDEGDVDVTPWADVQDQCDETDGED